MLTPPVELDGREKCYPYWPTENKPIEITTEQSFLRIELVETTEDTHAGSLVRRFNLIHTPRTEQTKPFSAILLHYFYQSKLDFSEFLLIKQIGQIIRLLLIHNPY